MEFKLGNNRGFHHKTFQKRKNIETQPAGWVREQALSRRSNTGKDPEQGNICRSVLWQGGWIILLWDRHQIH